MDPTQQSRAVAVDLAIKLFASHNRGQQGRQTRAGDVVEVAKVFHTYMREGK